MLGQPNSLAHVAATPKPPGNPKRPEEQPLVDGVTVVSSVENESAIFAAVHEPFESARESARSTVSRARTTPLPSASSGSAAAASTIG